ncbi:DUF4252 domain-containing protein [Bacteroides sp. UBA939]|uniref:DUF4252 domain-containing protein n=1 Tax=Bacteroides sp. UBA939 TaxID=1946092 RepID=UPI0025BA9C28|nr:DUF4252 domain-containing protein [Bacteroides sp. UBA939]
MKKCITLLTLLLVCQIGYSRNYSVDELFKEFSRAEASEKVKLGKFVMNIAGLFTETMGVDVIEVYDFDKCEDGVKQKLITAIKNLKDPQFETMITTNEGGSRTKILVKIEKDMIREMVVITTGDSHALIRIQGKIKPSDFEEVAAKHGKSGS